MKIAETITYHKEGDYYYPDVTLPAQPSVNIGKYGHMRLDYLREHKRPLYLSLSARCKLAEHLAEVDQTAREHVRQISAEIAKRNGATPALKREDPMAWVGIMNNAKHSAEEIVMAELIYA